MCIDIKLIKVPYMMDKHRKEFIHNHSFHSPDIF